MKNFCDAMVLGSTTKLIFVPIAAIFGGGLWGSGAFLAGAIIVSATLFCDFYFRMCEDALDT